MKFLRSLIFLLVSFTSLPLSFAEAEPWVLWQKKEIIKAQTFEIGEAEWAIIETYSRDADCRKNLERVWNKQKNDLQKLKKGSTGMNNNYFKDVTSEPYTVTLYSDYGATILTYFCIPACLDPRARK